MDVGKKHNYVFNSNIVLDCSDCSVSREAVPVSMFTCYYFLNFNTFVTVLNKHFEFQILCLQNCNSYPPSQEQYLLERLSGQRGGDAAPGTLTVRRLQLRSAHSSTAPAQDGGGSVAHV